MKDNPVQMAVEALKRKTMKVLDITDTAGFEFEAVQDTIDYISETHHIIPKADGFVVRFDEVPEGLARMVAEARYLRFGCTEPHGTLLAAAALIAEKVK